jgi:hypothetical protein
MGGESTPYAKEVAALLTNQHDGFVLPNAYALIGELGEEERAKAEQLVALWTKEQNSSLQIRAATALAKMGGDGAAYAKEVATLLTEEKDSSVRISAATALAKMGVRGAAYAKEVAGLLTKGQDDFVRISAATALGQMGEQGAAYAGEVAALLDLPNQVDTRAITDYLDRHADRLADKPAFHSLLLHSAHRQNIDTLQKRRFHLYLWFGHSSELLQTVRWLGRPEVEPMPEGGLARGDARDLLNEFSKIWESSKAYPALRRELSQRIGEVSQRISWMPDEATSKILNTLDEQLRADSAPAATTARELVQGALNRQKVAQGWKRFAVIVAIHFGCWLLLLFAYPIPWVQAFCFWNPWFRKFLGFPYVGLVLRWVPFARKRLFLPFAEVLVSDARLKVMESEHWFPDSNVHDEEQPQNRMPLRQAVPSLKGQTVLIGDSGLGKTMFLRQLVRTAQARGRIVAFLPAESCNGGVLEALENKLEGAARDKDFLRDLVYAGAMDVCIDGLNQVPPDTRAKVAEFMDRFHRGNLIVTTQPMRWRAPKLARALRLEPLHRDQILTFLQSREPALPASANIRGAEFLTQCEKWVTCVLAAEDGNAAVMVLSNPLDATVAAELIAQGNTPDVLDLREQQYGEMAAQYKDKFGMEFQLQKVAETAYEMRVAGREEFVTEGLEREIAYMEDHRMLVEKSFIQDTDGKEKKWWVFRHEKFLEFFVVHAFRGANRERREKHLGEPPFRGVYLRLALVLPMMDAEVLREILIVFAAATGDHSVSDDYIRILKQRQTRCGQN